MASATTCHVASSQLSSLAEQVDDLHDGHCLLYSVLLSLGRTTDVHIWMPTRIAQTRNTEFDSMLNVMAKPENPMDACAAPAADIPKPLRRLTAPSQTGWQLLWRTAMPKATSVKPDKTLRKLARPISI